MPPCFALNYLIEWVPVKNRSVRRGSCWYSIGKVEQRGCCFGTGSRGMVWMAQHLFCLEGEKQTVSRIGKFGMYGKQTYRYSDIGIKC